MSSSPWQPGPSPALLKSQAKLSAPQIARIIGPDFDVAAKPMEWRTMATGASTSPPAGSAAAQTAVSAELDALRAECEQRVRESRTAALREAEAGAQTRAAAEVRAALEKIARSAADLAQLRPRLRRDAESDTLQLALAIARRIVRRELAVEPEAIRGLVLAALEKLQAQEIYRVRVSQPHAEAVAKSLREAAGHIPIETIADASLPPGSIIFETNHGNLDASVDSQLTEIERGLTDLLHRRT